MRPMFSKHNHYYYYNSELLRDDRGPRVADSLKADFSVISATKALNAERVRQGSSCQRMVM